MTKPGRGSERDCKGVCDAAWKIERGARREEGNSVMYGTKFKWWEENGRGKQVNKHKKIQ